MTDPAAGTRSRPARTAGPSSAAGAGWRASLLRPPPPDVFWTFAALGTFTLLGLILIRAYAGEHAGGPLVAALACLAAGGGIGFLFGIPKILQSDRPAGADAEGQRAGTLSYRQQVNTNLTEISDWLTKIIVGLGLINLKEIPGILHRTAHNLAAGMVSSAAGAGPAAEQVARWVPLATGVLVCFSILGFVVGYLSTRLFLQAAFSRADQLAAAPIEQQIAALATDVDALKIRQSVRQVETADAAGSEMGAETGNGDAAALPSDAATDGGTEAETSRGTEEAPAPATRVPAEPESATPPVTRGKTRGSSAAIPFVSDKDEAMEELRVLADEYMAYHDPDYGTRVRWKDAMAARMAALIRKRGISRAHVAQMARETGHEGLVLAFATLVVDRPSPGDGARLLALAPLAERLHVRYRVVLGLSQLLTAEMLPSNRYTEVARVLDSYEETADRSLSALIARVRALLTRASAG